MANIPLIAVRCGTRIRQQRRQLQWTQKDLAVQAGLSYQYVSNIEKGEANPPIGTLEQIAKALGLRLSALVEDETPGPAHDAELAPLVFGLVADIHTAQMVLAAAVLPKLQRLSEVAGVPLSLPDVQEDPLQAQWKHSHEESLPFAFAACVCA